MDVKRGDKVGDPLFMGRILRTRGRFGGSEGVRNVNRESHAY